MIFCRAFWNSIPVGACNWKENSPFSARGLKRESRSELFPRHYGSGKFCFHEVSGEGKVFFRRNLQSGREFSCFQQQESVLRMQGRGVPHEVRPFACRCSGMEQQCRRCGVAFPPAGQQSFLFVAEFQQPDSGRCRQLPDEFLRPEEGGKRIVCHVNRFWLKVPGQQPVVVLAVGGVEPVVPQVIPVERDRPAAPGEQQFLPQTRRLRPDSAVHCGQCGFRCVPGTGNAELAPQRQEAAVDHPDIIFKRAVFMMGVDFEEPPSAGQRFFDVVRPMGAGDLPHGGKTAGQPLCRRIRLADLFR